MKYIHTIVFSLILACLAGACGTEETIIDQPTPVTQTIGDRDTLAGDVVGVMQAGKTYYMTGDVRVKAGDSLVIEPGVHLIDLGNHALYIRGSLTAHGTENQMIYMGPDAARRTPGSWGGILCDSPRVVSLKFCRIEYGCGVRPDGRARPSIHFFSNSQNTSRFYMEDCEVSYTKDDAIQLNGGTGYVLRSDFRMNGEIEGSGINFKSGFTGTASYNYIWSANDHAIRAITGTTVLFPQTTVDIYNNTIVNYGGKNPSRPGAGVLVDQNTRANVYNNIFVNGQIGFQLTQAADTLHTHYGNNLFYTTIDSLQRNFYPANYVGRPQPTDLIQVNPMFVAFDPDINALVDRNDPHLKPGSPAHGKGNPVYDPDIGAYTAKR